MTATLAADLGGTHLRAGLIEADGVDLHPLGRWPAPDGLEPLVDRLSGLAAEHGVGSVGLAVPGLAHAGRCTWVPNLPYLDGVDLAARLPGLRLAVGNDAQLALLAEARQGAARGVEDAILLAIGTGIGSAVLSGGRLLRGAGGAAASFGWATADPTDEPDGRSGWLERQASGRALDRIAAGIGLADGAALIGAARAGRPEATAALVPVGEALAATLAGTVALLGSQVVIVTGGVASAMDVLAPLVLPLLRQHLPPHLRGIEIRAGKLGEAASLLGAGLAARGEGSWDDG